jgi:hypothetical protein
MQSINYLKRLKIKNILYIFIYLFIYSRMTSRCVALIWKSKISNIRNTIVFMCIRQQISYIQLSYMFRSQLGHRHALTLSKHIEFA